MGFGDHYKALLYKNWIKWKRNLLGSLMEILFPIGLMVILVIIRTTIVSDDYPAESYLASNTTLVWANGSLTRPEEAFQQCRGYQHEIQLDWVVMVAPSSFPITQALTAFLNSTLKHPQIHVQSVQDNSFIEDYVTASDYKDQWRLCFAVVFDEAAGDTYRYRIRFNQTETIPKKGRRMGKDQDIFQTELSAVDSISREPTQYQSDYLKTGFIYLQNWVDNYILATLGHPNSYIQPTFVPLYFDNYISDSFLSVITQVLPIFVIITYVIPVARMILQTTSEKESRIKEVMMMMGLTNKAYWLSWVTYYFAIYTVIAGGITLVTSFTVFEFSAKGYIFLFFWLFGMSCIAYCFLIQAFFSRARTAFLLGIMVFLVQYFISFGVASASGNAKNGVSLLPPAAFALACNNLGNFEKGRFGVNANTVNETFEDYKFSTALGFFVIDTIIFTLLGLYFEQVWPNELGIKKPWYFPVVPKYWGCKRRNSQVNFAFEKEVKWGENVEAVDEALEQQKDQGKAMMVRGLSKHFGAKVAVDALDLDLFEGQIFGLLGHNGAGKTTTISMLTGLLKATAGEMMVGDKLLSEDLSEIRKRLGVCPQHNVLFPELTIEEHLYVFSVFKGQTDRRVIREKSDEILEAVDLLSQKSKRADRLSGGQKRKLSLAMALVGNSQIILLDEPTAGMDITARRQMWDMLKNSKAGKIILLTTHYMEEADILADRIAIISDGKMRCCGSPLYLKSRFGVGYYLNLVKQPGLMSAEHSQQVTAFVKSYVGTAQLLNDIPGEIAFQMPLSEVPHFKDMFLDLDQRMGALGLHSYGVSVTTLEEVFLRVASGAGTMPLAAIAKNDSEAEPKPSEMQALTEPINFTLANDRLQGSLLCTHMAAMLRKRLLTNLRDYKSLLFEIFIPIILVVFGLGLIILMTRFKNLPGKAMDLTQYDTPQEIIYSGAFAGLDILRQNPLITLKPTPNTSPSAFDSLLFAERDADPYHMGAFYFISDYSFAVFHNQTAIWALPTFYQVASTALLRSIRPALSIEVINEPLPITQQVESANGVGAGFLGSMVFSLGFSFIPTGIVAFISKEREMAVKHQHVVSGVSLPAYWLTNFVWDFTKHFVPAVVCSLAVLGFQVDSLASPNESYGALWLLMVLFGFCAAPFAYFLSFLFKTSSSSQIVTLLLSFLAGCIGPTVIFMLRFFSAPGAAKALQWILRLIPTFCFGMGIMNLGSRDVFAVYDGRSEPYDALDLDSAGGDILMMGLTTVLYLVLILLMEYYSLSPWLRGLCKRRTTNSEEEDNDTDDDVEREAAEALRANPEDAQLVIQQLRQIYRNLFATPVVAVKNVSFKVGFKETFALLGVNGAGKTSTFRMLTGEYAPTSGQAYVCAKSVSTNLSKIRKVIGYCPQFDALNEMLTGRELLEIYADMKGIPKQMRTAMVTEIMTELDLLKYENVRCGTYSGGNKRKLSVAMALLGNPSVVFLDEPSAGMDPEARKKMWTVIGNIKKRNAAIILTTHSMEEAESLCDRIAIMVGGQIRCIGTSTHIKNKFGSGYEIEIKVHIPTRQEVEARLKSLSGLLAPGVDIVKSEQILSALQALGRPEYQDQIKAIGKGASLFNQLQVDKFVPTVALAAWVITEEYGDAIEKFLSENYAQVKLIEHYLSFYKFKVEKQADKSLGALFSSIEGNKTQLSISEYSVTQTSLEQIFNQFARMGGHIPE